MSFFSSEHDLVILAQHLLELLPLCITGSWIKGHYQGANHTFGHVQNEAADNHAALYQQQQTSKFSSSPLS
jgi:hypothetical protein